MVYSTPGMITAFYAARLFIADAVGMRELQPGKGHMNDPEALVCYEQRCDSRRPADTHPHAPQPHAPPRTGAGVGQFTEGGGVEAIKIRMNFVFPISDLAPPNLVVHISNGSPTVQSNPWICTDLNGCVRWRAE